MQAVFGCVLTAMIIGGPVSALYSLATGEWRWLLVTALCFIGVRGVLRA